MVRASRRTILVLTGSLLTTTVAGCSASGFNSDAADAALPTAIRSSDQIAEVVVSRQIQTDGTTASVATVVNTFSPTGLAQDAPQHPTALSAGDEIYVKQEGTPEHPAGAPILSSGTRYLLFLVQQTSHEYSIYLDDAGIYQPYEGKFAHLVMGSRGYLPTSLTPETLER